MMTLFGTITSAQYTAGIVANSLALQADCVSMGVDTLSYVGNLLAECTVSPIRKRRLELVMGGVSLSLLAGFTTRFIFEAVDNVTKPLDGDEGDDVNAYIVLGFALGGVTFDIISLIVFKVFALDHGHGHGGAKQEDHGHSHGGCDSDEPATDAEAPHITDDVNMMSALAHVVSDLMRSSTTICEGVILLATSVNGTRADGWSALIVCSTIAVGAVVALLAWVREVHKFCTESDDEVDFWDSAIADNENPLLHPSADHGHGHGAPRQAEHGHSHGGAPCSGHGAPKQAEHGHGHGAAKQSGHGHGAPKQADHGHGHGAAKQAAHGHGHGAAKQAEHGHGHGAAKQAGHGHGAAKQSGHGHGHGAAKQVDHGHSHGGAPCSGHGEEAPSGHGQSNM